MIEWKDAPEVKAVVKELINEHHGRLLTAKIKSLFREGAWSSQRKETWAKVYKVTSRDKHLTGYDFYLAVNQEVWEHLDTPARIALIDHELCHCDRDDDSGKWCTYGHDLEDFIAVVARHGAWTDEAKKYLQAAEDRKAGAKQVSFEDFVKRNTQPEERNPGLRVVDMETGEITGEVEKPWMV